MNGFEDEVRTLMQADPVEVPVDLDAVLDGGREAVRGRRLGWTVAGLTVGAVVASIVTPILIAQTIPAVPAPVDTPTVAATATAAPVPRLAGTAWTAEEVRGVPVATGTSISITFEDGRVAGGDGCNSFGGSTNSFTQDGDRISLGNMTMTLKLCDDAVVMTQAKAFGEVLKATTNFRVDDGRLVLLDTAGTPLATFAEFRVDGRTWSLDPATGKWAGQDPGLTLAVEGTTVSGNSGCGSYTATLTREGSRWSISNLTNEPISCPYEAGRRSGVFLARLAKISFGTALPGPNPVLLLRTAAGSELRFLSR
ncbi:MAG: META domain-containing protein [Actinobacteria bacterium]|nr:META domain-containing protein [Actinomycetota bacterium]